jgi:hypothetical protein
MDEKQKKPSDPKALGEDLFRTEDLDPLTTRLIDSLTPEQRAVFDKWLPGLATPAKE